MLHLRRLWLTDFRNYGSVDVELPPGTTAVLGANGQGKTNLLEAVAHLAGTSMRGAATETMVRVGAERAVARAEAVRGARELLVEAELAVRGRSRVQLNRQPVKRRGELLEALSVTVFSPEDLVLVKGGPGERRDWVDAAVVGLDPHADQTVSDVARILKQRNALLKSVRGSLDDSAALTLDVWDDRLATAGGALVRARRAALDQLTPRIAVAYLDIAGRELSIDAAYRAGWAGDDDDGEAALRSALTAARSDDLRRGVTTVGPHRDEIAFALDGLPARTHASQGEQRSLALAMRLAVHRAVTDARGASPILLLDDVLSELDDARATALLAHLPGGQTLLTSATALPAAGVPEAGRPELVLDVSGGTVRAR